MADLSIAIEILGKDSFSPVARGITGTLGGLFEGASKLGMGVFGITQLAEGIGGLAQGMVSGNVQMETYQTQLETLMGSADAAKDRIAQLAQIGADTPFDLPQLVASEKILMGFGLTTEKTTKLTGKSLDQFRTSLGDMAAGTGADLGELTNLWGKFSSGATGEAISRLQELGIVTREQLTEVGVQFSKSGELTSPLPQAMEAAVKIADQKFGGGMKKLSQTFAGQMSTLSDTFGQAKVALMAPIFDVLKDSLTSVNAFLSSGTFQDALKSVAALMAGGVKTAIDGLTAGFMALQPWLVRAQDAWGTLVQVFAGDWSPAEDIDPLVNMLGQFATVVANDVLPPVQQFAGFLQDNWQPILAAVGTLMAGPLLGALGSLAVGIGAAGLAFVAAAAPIALLAGSFILLKNAWDSNVGDVQGKATQLMGILGPGFTQLGLIAQQAIGGDLAGAFDSLSSVLGSMGEVLGTMLSGWGAEFLAWLEPIASPLLAQAQDLAGQLVGWVVEQAPVLLAQLMTWGQQFVDWIAPQIPPLLAQLQVLGTQALAWIQQQAAPILESLTAWGIQFVEWVQPQIPPLLAQLGALGLQLIGWVRAQLPGILATLTEWGLQFMAWVGPAIPPLLAEAGKLIGELWGWIRTNAPGIAKELASWAAEMAAWVVTAIPPLLLELGKFLFRIGDWIVKTGAPEVLGFALDMGTSIVQGIMDGIGNWWGKLTTFFGDKLRTLITVDMTGVIGAHSPSKLTAEMIGTPMVEGIIDRITAGTGALRAAVAAIVNNAIINGIDPLIALALSKAESSLNPNAGNFKGESSIGLFQLNQAGGQGAGISREKLSDPQFNAAKFLSDHAALYKQLVAEGLAGEELVKTFGRLAEVSDPALAMRYVQAYRELGPVWAAAMAGAGALTSSTAALGSTQQQGITWAQEMARQQEVLTGTLNGQAPAGRAAGDAMTALGAALGPVERRVAEGSMNLGQLEFKLIDLARATGIATEPWDRFSAGTIDADAAMEEVIRKSAGISPAFASVATYLDTAGSSSREAALQFLQLALNYKTAEPAIAAVATATGTAATQTGDATDAVSSLTGKYTALKPVIGEATDLVKAFQKSIDELNPGLVDDVAGAWGGLAGKIGDATKELRDYLSTLGDGGGGGDIPHFARGGTMDHDGLAFLHAGERVLTPGASANPIMASGGGGGGDTYVFNFPNYVGSRSELVSMVKSELTIDRRRNGKLPWES